MNIPEFLIYLVVKLNLNLLVAKLIINIVGCKAVSCSNRRQSFFSSDGNEADIVG